MDRQDIDALLIGALYGELTPAEEARLATHLESHPTDRGALDDLKVARQAVVDSRIFAVHLDPPQHISALLLQEAHRRAPKAVAARDEKEGWFARFTRSFMAHPAMAAAAMLVLVIGGAGIMYSRQGDQQFASREVGQSAPAAQIESAEMVAPSAGSTAVAEGSAFRADLYEAQGVAQDDNARQETATERWKDQAADKSGARDELAKQKAPSRGMVVNTERSPKDFGDADGKYDEASPATGGTRGKAMPKPGKVAASKPTGGYAGDTGLNYGTANAVSGAGPGRGADSSTGYAQPPPANTASKGAVAGPTTGAATTTATTAPTTPSPDRKAPAQAVAKNSPPPAPAPSEPPRTATVAAPKPEPAPAKEAKKDESSLIAWAKGEHARAVTLAKNGDCAGAAKVALSVSTRASTYAQTMATDRALKQCAQYINAERDKEAERTQKARASKRVNADEPASK